MESTNFLKRKFSKISIQKKASLSLLLSFCLFSKVFALKNYDPIFYSLTTPDGEWTCFCALEKDETCERPARYGVFYIYQPQANQASMVRVFKTTLPDFWNLSNICYSEITDAFYFAYYDMSDPNHHYTRIYECKRWNGEKFTNANVFHQFDWGISGGHLVANEDGLFYLRGVYDEDEKQVKGYHYTRLYKIFDSNGKKAVDIPTPLIGEKFLSHKFYYENFQIQPKPYNEIIIVKNNKLWVQRKYDGKWICYDTKKDKVKSVSPLEIENELKKKNPFICNPIYENQNSRKNKLLVQIILFAFIFSLALFVTFFILWIHSVFSKKRKLQKNILSNTEIYSIQETERAKISRDLHDTVVQDMRAIRIKTELLKVEDQSKVLQSEIEQMTTDSITKLRNICYNLTPPELSNHTANNSSKVELISIIQTLTQQFSLKNNIPCPIKIDKNFDYPILEKSVTLNVYRVIQEALTNIEKHSYAINTSILIKNKIIENQKFMMIYIIDDGVGFDSKNIINNSDKLHFGVSGMKSRMELIGGKIEINSGTNDGTEIKLFIPTGEKI